MLVRLSKNHEMLKPKYLILTLVFSLFCFALTLIAIGAITISAENTRFNNYVQAITQKKERIILLSLLTEAEIDAYRNETPEEVISEANTSFEDVVYRKEQGSQLDYVEAIARKVIHTTENSLGKYYRDPNAVLFFRSFTGNKVIQLVDSHDLEETEQLFDTDMCAKFSSCTLAAKNAQLMDRILVSKPYLSTISDQKQFNITSPIYMDGKLVGEFGERNKMGFLYSQGKNLEARKINNIDLLYISYPQYPMKIFSYKQSYMIDNEKMLTYEYPLIKIVLDNYYFFIFYLIAAFSYFYKLQQSETHKQQLNSVKGESIKDELTGLYNRKVFNEVSTTMESEPEYTVIAVDGNKIKAINDKYGHHVGDDAIVTIAESIESTFRNSDIAVRTGGDEFVIVLPACSYDDALPLVEKLKQKVESSKLNLLGTQLSISAGIAEKRENDLLSDVMVRADKELYREKSDLQ